MDKLARLPAGDRRDIFTEAASKLGIRPTIVEKDFWVCLVLKFLFQKSPFGKSHRLRCDAINPGGQLRLGKLRRADSPIETPRKGLHFDA
jgi:hypothetical protein